MTDPRVDRTRAALRAASINLASDRPVRDITVSQLTTEASVNRATFYSHYDAVDDVVVEALTSDLDTRRDANLALRSNGDRSPNDALRAELLDCIAHVRAFEGVYRQALSPGADDGVWRAMREHFAASLRASFDAHVSPPEGVDAGIAAIAGAHTMVGAIIGWLRDASISEELFVSTLERSRPAWFDDLYRFPGADEVAIAAR